MNALRTCRRAVAWLAALATVALWQAPAAAEPLAADAPVEPPALMADVLAVDVTSPAAVTRLVIRSTTDALVQRQLEDDRRTLLHHAYTPRPPTWIQLASTINLGDFPTLDDPLGRAERELQTLEWLIEQRRLEKTPLGAALQNADGSVEGGPTLLDVMRRLLPGTWIPWLKANRDLLLAGGTLLLVALWIGAAFDRRGGNRRVARRSSAAGVPVSNGAAPDALANASAEEQAAAPRRRRRRRRRGGLAHASRRRRRSKALPWWVRWFSPSRGV
ncbi:MAG: hypothetical protein ABI696_11885 [Rubrivivax sp.]